jgi:hypothetical protein
LSGSRQVNAGHSHCGDTFLAADKSEEFIGSRFDSYSVRGNLKGSGNIDFHLDDVGVDLGLLGNERGVDVHNHSAGGLNSASGFFEKNAAGCAPPAWVSVGKIMSNIGFAQGSQDGIANGVHQDIGIGVAVEALGMGNFHATQDKASAFNQGVDVITDADMNH